MAAARSACLSCLVLLALVMSPAAVAAAKCQTKDGLTTFQWLERTANVTVFTSLIRQAGLVKTFNDKAKQFTIFVPLDYAFGALLPPTKGYFDILPGKEVPRVLVNYHIALPAVAPSKLEDGLELTAGLRDPKGKLMTLNITENPIDLAKPVVINGAVNTANITRPLGKPLSDPLGVIACNSVVYLIDEVLLPSNKLIISDKPRVTAAAAKKTALSFEPLVTPREGTPGTSPGRKTGK